MNMINLIDTGVNTAKTNMEIDQKLLETLDPEGPIILHFYDWESPSITYGYFMKPEELLDFEALQNEGIEIARRPTGGGVVFHLWDLAFSILVPSKNPYFSENPLENYSFINQKIQEAGRKHLQNQVQLTLLQNESPPLEKVFENFCMAKPTKYDVMLDGKKMAGAAQRKKKQGYLHQGTISLARPVDKVLRSVLSKHPALAEAMYQNSFYFLREEWTKEDLLNARSSFKELIYQSFLETNSNHEYNAPLFSRGNL